MYFEFYQLKENPFNVTADPDFFFASQTHSEAISTSTMVSISAKVLSSSLAKSAPVKTTYAANYFEAVDNVKFALF